MKEVKDFFIRGWKPKQLYSWKADIVTKLNLKNVSYCHVNVFNLNYYEIKI